MTTSTEAPATAELDAAIAKAAEWRQMTDRIKEVLVDRLELPIPANWITDDQALFGRGLELDSLDALELSMAIDQEFGTPVYEENTALFGSVSAFLGYMLEKQSELPPEEAARIKAMILEKTGIDASALQA
ncbi:acyl carrier protein [Spongisporangium articulatum]|uniref:Acyl carrier protein n=1 Tax=Spongisporangium articulatum TaxID=3362603 RepID=A0ABW8AIM1_9ACTN